MNGESIAYLIAEWAEKKDYHADDFANLFVSELIEKLLEDKERII